jgi:hypothetical protein
MKNYIITSLTLAILMLIALTGLAASVSAITISDISVSPGTIEPGGKAHITVKLENNFDSDVENVAVSVDLSKVPISPDTSSSVFTEKIKENKNDDFDFTLHAQADAEAGVYKFPLMIQYDLDGKTVQETSSATLTVNAKPSLSLTADGYLIAGKNKVTIKITNTGLGQAKFLSVNAGEGNYKLLSSNEAYIGDLNSDDFDSVSFDINVVKPGTITIPVTLTYRDFVNNEYEEEDEVSVRIYSQQEAIQLGLVTQNQTGMYIGGVAVLIILYLIYRRVRKWAKQKKANRMNGGD